MTYIKTRVSQGGSPLVTNDLRKLNIFSPLTASSGSPNVVNLNFEGGLDSLNQVVIGSPLLPGQLLEWQGSPQVWTNVNITQSPDQNLFETVASDSGSTTANTTTDTLTIAGGTGISTSISGDTLTIVNDSPNVEQDAFTDFSADAGSVTATSTTSSLVIAGGTGISTSIAGSPQTLTITNDSPNVDQNLFETVSADTGSTTADTTTDTLTIAGGTGISTSIAGDTVTITNDSPNADQNVFTDFTADTGSVTAGSTTSALNFAGGGDIFTTIAGSPQTLTIDIGRSVVLRQNGGLTQTFNTTTTTVLFNTDIRTDGEFSYSAGQVTATNAGWYEIIYEVSVEHTTSTGFFSTATATAQSSIYINSVESTGTRSYAWFHGAAPAGSTMTGRAVLNLSASDTVEVQVVRSGGVNLGLQTIAEGCRLFIQSTDAP